MQTDSMKVTEVITLNMTDKAEVIQRADGAVMCNPRVGRIGIQHYTGKELGRPDLEVVRVYRPESEVMDKSAMSSVTHRPVTNDHPPEPVTADNWKKYAVGHTGDVVARDGEFIRVPMMLSDARVIKDFYDGKKQLSLGYTSNLEWRTGTTAQGDTYDAVQTNIRINHLAVVDTARGGTKLAIGDSGVTIHDSVVADAKRRIAAGKVERTAELSDAEKENSALLCLPKDGSDARKYAFVYRDKVYRKALESIKAQAVADQSTSIVEAADELLNLMDAKPKGKKMTERSFTTIMIDGQSVEVTDLAASTILRKLEGLKNESNDLFGKFSASELKRKEAEEKFGASAEEEKKSKKKMEEDAATIATLKQQLSDAAITPAKLDALVRDRATTIIKARSVLGDKLVVDGKTDGDMRKQVVSSKLGDQAKDWSDDAVSASFATLTADIKVDPAKVGSADALRASFSGQPAIVDGGGPDGKVYKDYNKRLQDAWKHPNGVDA